MAIVALLIPRLVIVVPVEQRNRILIFLSPGGIHSQHHFRPVVGICSAVASVDRQNGARTVIGTIEQRLQFQLLDLLLKLGNFTRNFCFERRVLFGHFKKDREVIRSRHGLPQGFYDRLECLEFADGLLGRLLVVPEARLAHLGLQQLNLFQLTFVVKDCPAVEAGVAESLLYERSTQNPWRYSHRVIGW